MTKRTKKVKSAGRFRAGYGSRVRHRIAKIESEQKKRQQCPYCKKYNVKRIASGIWQCKSCGRKFTGGAYIIRKSK